MQRQSNDWRTEKQVLPILGDSKGKKPKLRGRTCPLEEGMATYSNILAWRIPMDRGAWWAKVHGVTTSRTQLRN